jgi:glutathione S-transferase
VAQLKILEGHIAGKAFFALDRLTLADVALAPIVKRCIEFPIEKPDLPELSRWMKSMEARPAFAVATGAKPSALNTAA